MTRSRIEVSTELAELQQRVRTWRATRPKLAPMPEQLWQAAAVLARRIGVSRVATALGLGFTRLKQRASDAPVSARRGPAFIELAPVHAVASEPVVVEVRAADGMRVTLRLPASQVLDLRDVVAALRPGLA